MVPFHQKVSYELQGPFLVDITQHFEIHWKQMATPVKLICIQILSAGNANEGICFLKDDTVTRSDQISEHLLGPQCAQDILFPILVDFMGFPPFLDIYISGLWPSFGLSICLMTGVLAASVQLLF
uniref:Uncharacterized protein n=1 Tax=Romanomermis culicivorax TaxID=13658 RepID=A0A915K5Z7_ROMCU